MASSFPPAEPFVVLSVEDDPGHAALIQAAFSYAKFARVHVTASAEEAVDYLLGRWPFDNRTRYPLPDVIILDLGLPGLGGLDFLDWLDTRSEHWRHVPVVIFTANNDPAIAQQALEKGASQVEVKPGSFVELVQAVNDILKRWRPNIA